MILALLVAGSLVLLLLLPQGYKMGYMTSLAWKQHLDKPQECTQQWEQDLRVVQS